MKQEDHLVGVVENVTLNLGENRAFVSLLLERVETVARVSLFGSIALKGLESVKPGDALWFPYLEVLSISDSRVEYKVRYERETTLPIWQKLPQKAVPSTFSDLHDDRTVPAGCAETVTTVAAPRLPCRRRRLGEIQSPGLLSHVQVKILSFEVSFTRSRKRRRRSTQQKVHTHSSLSDGRTFMTMTDCQRFASVLSVASGKKVLITKVLSTLHGDEIVLVPTSSSLIAPVQDEGNRPSTQSSDSRTPMSLTHGLPARMTRRCLRSPLEGIYFEALGVCLDEKGFLSPTGFANLILQDMTTYRPASIVLCEKQGGLFSARGSPQVMKVLCGDAAPSDFADFALRRPVMELLQSLLKGAYLLEWTLECEGARDNFRVAHVHLPSI